MVCYYAFLKVTDYLLGFIFTKYTYTYINGDCYGQNSTAAPVGD